MPFLWFDKDRREPELFVLPVSNSTTQPTPHKKSVSFNKATWKNIWAAFKERLGSGSALSESLLLESGELEKLDPALIPVPILNSDDNNTIIDEDEGPIDEVVVDNLMSSDEITHRTPTEALGTGTGGSPEKGPVHESRPGTAITDNDGSLESSDFAWMYSLWTIIRWRLFPPLHRFFFLQFHDAAMEAQFSREAWFTNKQLALWARLVFSFFLWTKIRPPPSLSFPYSSLFYVLNWIIGCVLLPPPHPLMERIYYWGVSLSQTFYRHSQTICKWTIDCSTHIISTSFLRRL